MYHRLTMVLTNLMRYLHGEPRKTVKDKNIYYNMESLPKQEAQVAQKLENKYKLALKHY